MQQLKFEGFEVDKAVRDRLESVSKELASIFQQIAELDPMQRALLIREVLPTLDTDAVSVMLEKTRSDDRIAVITLRLDGKKTSLSLPRSVSNKAKAQMGEEAFLKFVIEKAGLAKSLGVKNKSGYVADKLLEALN